MSVIFDRLKLHDPWLASSFRMHQCPTSWVAIIAISAISQLTAKLIGMKSSDLIGEICHSKPS